MLAVIAALVASLLYGLASVLQQREAERQPGHVALRLGLLGRLAREPWWLAGIVADAGGFVLQFIALDHGALVLVQPLLVTGLLVAIPLRARLAGRPKSPPCYRRPEHRVAVQRLEARPVHPSGTVS